MHQSMDTLLVVDMIIPKHVRIRDVGLGMPLVRAVHARKLDRIADKKNRQVIEDKILVSLLGEQFHCPTTDISDGVARALLSCDSRDTAEERSLLSYACQELGVCDV